MAEQPPHPAGDAPPAAQHPPHAFARLGWLGYLGYLLIVITALLDALAIVLGISEGGYGFAFDYPTIRLLTIGAVVVAGSGCVLLIVELIQRRVRPDRAWPGIIIALVLAAVSMAVLFFSFAAQQSI